MVTTWIEYKYEWGCNLRFHKVLELARDTPDDVLRVAWGCAPEEVSAVKRNERPMSVRELGALAEVHRLTLLDVVSF